MGVSVSTYHELPSHQDDDAAIGGGLRIGRAELVLDLLEREALHVDLARPNSTSSVLLYPVAISYRELLDDAGSAE